MKIFTIGFTQKSARQFFETLKKAEIKQLIDIRLNNTSQLAGFAKQEDIAYFLEQICGASYLHLPILAPTREMLDKFKKMKGDWDEYEREFNALMVARRIEIEVSKKLFRKESVLLCSEHEPQFCHRRLVVEYLQAKWNNVHIIHL